MRNVRSNSRRRLVAQNVLKLSNRIDLYESNFRGRDIGSVDFDESDIQRSDFIGASLTRVSFKGSNLEGSKFTDAVLKDVDFTSADLTSVDFTGATFIGSTKFKNAKASGAIFSEKSLSRIISTGVVGSYYVSYEDSGAIADIGRYISTSLDKIINLESMTARLKTNVSLMLNKIEEDLERVEREYELEREKGGLLSKDYNFESLYTSKKRDLNKLIRELNRLDAGVELERKKKIKEIGLIRELDKLKKKRENDTLSRKEEKKEESLQKDLDDLREAIDLLDRGGRKKLVERMMVVRKIEVARKELGALNSQSGSRRNESFLEYIKRKKKRVDSKTLFKANRNVWSRLQIRISYLERNDKEELKRLKDFYEDNRKVYPRLFNLEKRLKRVKNSIDGIPDIPPGKDFTKHRRAITAIKSDLKEIAKCWKQISENDPLPKGMRLMWLETKEKIGELFNSLSSKSKALSRNLSFFKKNL